MKKIMEEGLVIIVLLALASCGFQPEVTTKESSAQESSSQVEKENLQNDVATEVSGARSESESSGETYDKSKRHLEEFPFEMPEDVTIYEFDDDNLLGLRAIFVGDDTITYCFWRKLVWDGFKPTRADIEFHGLEEVEKAIPANDYLLKKTTHYYWVEIKRDEARKLKGFCISILGKSLRVFGIDKPIMKEQDTIMNITKSQTFDGMNWGDIEIIDLNPIKGVDD